jgi:predicted MFS family arabinose efflux permease
VLPVLLTRIPRLTTAERLTARMALIAADVWRFVRTRDGALAIAVLLSPAAIGGATGLLAASSHAWQASSDLVALVCGALSGLAAAPGCVAGGYLSNRFSARTVYVVGALIFAAGEAAMAGSPHTPATFAGFVLLNAFLLGVANGAYLALIYGCLSNRSVATLGSLLASLGQVPVTLVTLIVGRVATAHGANAMLLVEAGLGAASMAVFALLVWFWRPAPRLDLAAAIT